MGRKMPGGTEQDEAADDEVAKIRWLADVRFASGPAGSGKNLDWIVGGRLLGEAGGAVARTVRDQNESAASHDVG